MLCKFLLRSDVEKTDPDFSGSVEFKVYYLSATSSSNAAIRVEPEERLNAIVS